MYPEDLVKAVYNKDLKTNFVLDRWVISRGSIGDTAGQTPISVSVSVNDTNQSQLVELLRAYEEIYTTKSSRSNHSQSVTLRRSFPTLAGTSKSNVKDNAITRS